jgi:hypothetical protein
LWGGITILATDDAGNANSRPRARWLTPALWAAGVGLQFAAPLLRDRVPLSDDLFIGSMLAPWMIFAQVVVLAAVLALTRGPSRRWSRTARTVFAVAIATLLIFAQPDLIMRLAGAGAPLGEDPVAVALAWSGPLAFYVLPAALVVWAWLWDDPRLSLLRALGAGLVVIGILNFPFILWLTHLWDVYIRSSGGESTSTALSIGTLVAALSAGVSA